MPEYSKNNEFKANESNAYNDYFELYDDWGKVITKEKTRADIYREHLQTASKDKLIDIAIEGNALYTSANNLAYNRGLEIEKLKTEMQSQTNLVNHYNNIAYNSKVMCFVTICACALVIGVFYIYQYIKYRLKKYADKIRSETIEEINKNH